MRTLMMAMVVALAGAAAPERPKVGQPAPDFTLESSTGKPVHLAALKGRSVVIAFYPKAFTGG